MTETEPPHRLHALRQARAFCRRHAGAAGGARARRRHRFGLRRPRHLRALPDQCRRRRIRQARHHLDAPIMSRHSPRSKSATTRSAGWPPGRRLSCQTQILGDLVIDVPPESQVHKQVVRKEADTRAIELDPAPGCASSRSRSPTCTSPPPISSASTRRSKDQWEHRQSHLRSLDHRRPAEDAAQGRVEDHRRRLFARTRRRQPARRDLAGLP